MDKRPWDIVPALTEERLQFLAQRIITIRNEALESYDPQKGDGPWSLGCRVYERTIRQLSQEAVSGHVPWLTVDVDGLYATVKVSGWPLRIYRGEADRPSQNSLRSGQYDLELQPELPGIANSDKGWFWLIAVETERSGKIKSMVVQQANAKGQTRNAWRVPLQTQEIRFASQTDDDISLSNTRGVVALAKPEVDVGPPEIGVRDENEKKLSK